MKLNMTHCFLALVLFFTHSSFGADFITSPLVDFFRWSFNEATGETLKGAYIKKSSGRPSSGGWVDMKVELESTTGKFYESEVAIQNNGKNEGISFAGVPESKITPVRRSIIPKFRIPAPGNLRADLIMALGIGATVAKGVFLDDPSDPKVATKTKKGLQLLIGDEYGEALYRKLDGKNQAGAIHAQ